jgi:hypothetical protein
MIGRGHSAAMRQNKSDFTQLSRDFCERPFIPEQSDQKNPPYLPVVKR